MTRRFEPITTIDDPRALAREMNRRLEELYTALGEREGVGVKATHQKAEMVMNQNRISNLGKPIDSNDAVRLQDLRQLQTKVEDLINQVAKLAATP